MKNHPPYRLTSPHRQGSSAKRFAHCLLLSLAATSFAVPAADLRIRVFDRAAGVPLAGAAVCLGTSANRRQFGAARTDWEGYAAFTDPPQAPLVITASSKGYKGERRSLVMSNTDRLLFMSLTTGGGGVKCTLEATGPAATGGLVVDDFRINGGAGTTQTRTVTLNHSATGQPTHYRASQSLDFKDAGWEIYVPAPAFELTPGDGKKVVYFQVRRSSEINGAHLQTLSPVVRDAITLQQP